jgi:hypothetical protein
MCATCGCGQKDKSHPRYGKGPSGEKSYNMSKAMRNFDAIADALLTDDFEYVEKDDSRASTGRYATGMLFPGFHGAVAGKPGKKVRAAGNELGGNILGSAVGSGVSYGIGRSIGKLKSPRAAIAAAGLGGLIGFGTSATGSGLGVKRAQRKGHYKSQDNQA